MAALGGDSSEAWSVNNFCQIVGWAKNISGYNRACLFDPAGQGGNIDLNTLIDPASGWTLSAAYGINDAGWIVGSGIGPDRYQHAYLLTPEPATALLLGLGALVVSRLRKTLRY